MALQQAIATVQQHLDVIQPQIVNFYNRSSRNELLVLSGATFITIYNLIGYIRERREKLNLPPRVGYALPFFGHSLYLMFNAGKFLDWCQAKYGDLYDLTIFGSLITVASGRMGEEVLKADSEKLSIEEGILKGT